MKKSRIILAIVMFVSVLVLFSYIGTYGENVSDTQFSGAVLDQADFNRAFVGEGERTDPQDCVSFDVATAEMKNLSISDHSISFQLRVAYGDRIINQRFTGELKRGAKNNVDIYSLVAEFADPEDAHALKMVLFNCMDESDSSLMFAKHLNGTAHTKMYLVDMDGNLILFEIATPSSLKNRSIDNLDESSSDLNWWCPYVNIEAEEIEATDDALEMMGIDLKSSVNGNTTYSTWVNPTIFRLSGNIGSDSYVYYSLPYVEYIHHDVTSSPTEWEATFKVSEHMKYAGKTVYGSNIFQYYDVDIRFSAGKCTRFTRLKHQGRMMEGKTTIPLFATNNKIKILVKIAKKASDTLGKALTYAETISNLIKGLDFDDKELGAIPSDNYSLPAKSVTGGYKTDSKYYFKTYTDNGGTENGHYYRVTINPIVYDNVSERISASGALRVTFMTRNVGDSLSTPVSCSTGNIQLNYQSIGSRAS